jgi:hypothetical protein
MLHREVEAEIDAGRLAVGNTLWMADVFYIPRRKHFERNTKPVEVRINKHEQGLGYRPERYFYTAAHPGNGNPLGGFQESWRVQEEDRAQYFLTEAEAQQSYREQAEIAREAMNDDHDKYNKRFMDLKILLLSI